MNKPSKIRNWILTLTIILAILIPTSISTTKSQPVTTQTTTVYLVPSETTLNTSEVSVGYRFSVTAWVSNVTDLSSFQVALYYNASVINCTDAVALFVPMPGMPLGPAFTYFDPYWGVAMVGTTGMAGATPFTGTRDLAVFEFEIIAEPPEGGTLTSDLIISYKPTGGVYDTKLKDSAGAYISFTATDGNYVYVSPEAPPPPPEGTQLYVDPPEIILSTYEVSVGYLFNVTVWISNVTDLFGFQVALFYNASVINMTGASLPEDHVLAEQFSVPLEPVYAYFDSWGVCLIGFSCISGATPFSGYGKLAEFEFEIVASPPEGGNLTSYLVISPENSPPYPPPPQVGTYKTKLVDSAELPIEFNATDGYFEYSWVSALIGDLNDDGFVDMDDILIGALSFGGYPGHPRWNPIADLTKDEIVDIDDIVKIAVHYGDHL